MAAFAFAAATSLLFAAAAPALSKPRGVVSLNMCTDELLLLVGDPASIRSVSYLSHLREETPLWRRARRYGANDGTMLAAAALRPALVLTMGGAGGDRARLAGAIGATLLDLPYPQSLGDMIDSLRRVGRATGGSARAERIVALIEAGRHDAPRRTLDALWIDGSGRTIAPTGLSAEWLALAGLRQRASKSDRVTLETLLIDPPAVLVRSRYRSRQTSGATALARHPASRLVAARRTIETDGRRWTCGGPAMLPEMLRLRRALSP